jgi:hypothetical protein
LCIAAIDERLCADFAMDSHSDVTTSVSNSMCVSSVDELPNLYAIDRDIAFDADSMSFPIGFLAKPCRSSIKNRGWLIRFDSWCYRDICALRALSDTSAVHVIYLMPLRQLDSVALPMYAYCRFRNQVFVSSIWKRLGSLVRVSNSDGMTDNRLNFLSYALSLYDSNGYSFALFEYGHSYVKKRSSSVNLMSYSTCDVCNFRCFPIGQSTGMFCGCVSSSSKIVHVAV